MTHQHYLIIFLIVWFLTGALSFIVFYRKHRGRFVEGDKMFVIIYGLLGLVGLIVCISTHLAITRRVVRRKVK